MAKRDTINGTRVLTGIRDFGEVWYDWIVVYRQKGHTAKAVRAVIEHAGGIVDGGPGGYFASGLFIQKRTRTRVLLMRRAGYDV